jgi:hypothetical protein
MGLLRNGRRLAAPLWIGWALSACSPAPRDARTEAPPAPAPPPPSIPTPPPLALPPPILGRAELLAAVDAAAAAYAGGEESPKAVADLGGRRFTLRLPFGCFGPADPGDAVGYRYDAKKGTLRISARAQVWTDTPWARSLAGGADTEAITGFWLRRPWLREERCPISSGVEGAPAPETVGLAQVFDKGSSRLLLRGERPFEIVRKVAAEDAPAPGEFRLVLQGRVQSSDARPPAACVGDHPDRRPVCLVFVELDRVAVEGRDGQLLAEWKS